MQQPPLKIQKHNNHSACRDTETGHSHWAQNPLAAFEDKSFNWVVPGYSLRLVHRSPSLWSLSKLETSTEQIEDRQRWGAILEAGSRRKPYPVLWLQRDQNPRGLWGGTMYHDPRRERKAELDSDRHVRSGDQAAPPIKRVPRGGMRWGSLRWQSWRTPVTLQYSRGNDASIPRLPIRLIASCISSETGLFRAVLLHTVLCCIALTV